MTGGQRETVDGALDHGAFWGQLASVFVELHLAVALREVPLLCSMFAFGILGHSEMAQSIIRMLIGMHVLPLRYCSMIGPEAAQQDGDRAVQVVTLATMSSFGAFSTR